MQRVVNEILSIILLTSLLCGLCNCTSNNNDTNSLPTLTYTFDPEKVFNYTPSEKDLLFMKWLTDAGSRETGAAKFIEDGLGGITMIYARNVTRGTHLFSIAHAAMIYTSSENMQPETIQALRILRENFRLPGDIANDLELTEISLLVAFERHNPKSFWAPYLQRIYDPLCPAFFEEHHTKALEYPWLTDHLDYFFREVMNNLANLQKLPEFQALAWDTIAYDVKWGLSTVLQRAFSWGPDKRREYVLVPMLDMINHRQGNKNNYYYNGQPLVIPGQGKIPVSYGMTMGADDEYVAGTEVFISYSKLSNNVQLLLQYGFVLENENDRIVIIIAENAKGAGVSTHRYQRCAISKDGLIPSAFLSMLSVYMGREQEVSVEAMEYIREEIQKDYDSFSTTLEEDEELIKQTQDRMMWSAIAYRIQAKKFTKNVLAKIDEQIQAFKDGTYREYHPKNNRYEWPLRLIAVNPLAKFKEALKDKSRSKKSNDNEETVGVATSADL